MKRRLCAFLGGVAVLLCAGSGAVQATPLAPGHSWQEVTLAGHLLRRLGFGPSPHDMEEVLQTGPRAWVLRQLRPDTIDDSELEAMLPPPSSDFYDAKAPAQRWYMRMAYSRRQLLERMVFTWHEHFATSNDKVHSGCYMAEQEETLRRHALGKFPQLLKAMARDQAMLVWLDNDGNDGKARDESDRPVPPNENFARELLQLFALGTDRLRMDGTVVRDAHGNPLPAYGESDVRALARALTGWEVTWRQCGESSYFEPGRHDNDDKVLFGETIAGQAGIGGYRELDQAIDIIVRQSSVAPFIARMLIERLATETPSPAYVERVASVFRDSGGDIRLTVASIAADPEFRSPQTIRSQVKAPVEHFVGIVRALEAQTDGYALYDWTGRSGQRVYYPPSVFGFYPRGDKGALLNTARVIVRDNIANELINEQRGVAYEPWRMIGTYGLDSPEKAVAFLAERLLAAPLEPTAEAIVVDYMDGVVTEDKLKGAIYLILVSPDFQLN